MQFFNYILLSIGLTNFLEAFSKDLIGDTLSNLGKKLHIPVKQSDINEKIALERFRKYITIDTSHPSSNNSTQGVNYQESKKFIVDYIKEVGLTYEIFECKPGKPFIIAKYAGIDSTLPSVLLNSHQDVVPVEISKWKYNPFGAEIGKDKSGADVVYGRGTQDNKSAAISYLEAVRALKKKLFIPKRNLYITFGVDEEIGGIEGMKCFVETDQFKKMNVGFAIDEGTTAGRNDVFAAFYSERNRWAFRATAQGDTGHASIFVKNLATDKLAAFAKLMRKFREEQQNLMDPKNPYDASVTVSNLNLIKAGIAGNVVPDSVVYEYDMRVSPTQDPEGTYQNILLWANQTDVKVEFTRKDPSSESKNIVADPYFKKLYQVAKKEFNVTIAPMIFPAASDAKYLRYKGIPTIGFAPQRAQPVLAHAHDEYMKISILNESIYFFARAIPELTWV